MKCNEAAAKWRSKISKALRVRNKTARAALAEFLGTFMLLVLGDGSVAQYILSNREVNSFLSINFAWGIAVMSGVYISGGVSGGHINPAVSLVMWILGRLSFVNCLVYMLAQYLGAFVGSAVVFGAYHDALNNFDGGNRSAFGPQATAGILVTFPADYLGTSIGLLDQIVGTMLLLLLVMAITDERNMAVPKGLIPVSIGLGVLAIGASFGMNCSYAINPARDLGPRLFTLAAGWGTEPFDFKTKDGLMFWWIPILGPHIGAILGAFIYQLFIGMHHPDVDDDGTEIDDTYALDNKTSQSSLEMGGMSNEGFTHSEDVKAHL